jgi:hypothetical protein
MTSARRVWRKFANPGQHLQSTTGFLFSKGSAGGASGEAMMGAIRVGKSPGRPPKFAGPSRVVTVTLPEETLARLAELDGDRALAIVRATELAVASLEGRTVPAVEVQEVSTKTGVITVPASPALLALRGLRLIEIRPSRYLIVLEPGTALAEVEISVLDALEGLAPEGQDHTVLTELLRSLRASRRSERARTGELILVDI